MGPLKGVRIIEIAGVGPGPFAAMLLSDLGADVVTIHRPMSGAIGDAISEVAGRTLGRGRRSVIIDLKSPDGLETAKAVISSADALIEGFRPGVMERLGLGPDDCLKLNSKLVYGRMTGWGQDGPLAQSAGHDINFLGIAGVLAHVGRKAHRPTPPMNLVGDFGGGGMLLALGLVSALLEARASGQGQIVDASMVDGAALLMTMMYELHGQGSWSEERESNLNDGAPHFYDTYETSDGRHVAIGAMEVRFYRDLLERIGVDPMDLPEQWDREQWPHATERLAAVFLTRTRDEWSDLLEGTDACYAPVLTMGEAPSHPHNVARATFTDVDGIIQPAPAPRFSRTPAEVQRPQATPGEHTDEVLAELGFAPNQVAELRDRGAVG